MRVQPSDRIRVWDPCIRIFHWSLAASFLLNYVVLEEGENLHEWVGYYALALIAIRIVWGFIGPQNARFSDFWPTPARVKAHMREYLQGKSPSPDRHNPVGGLMILALLASMLATGVTGWLSTTDIFWGEESIEELHEGAANLVTGLVCLHITAIVWFSHKGPHNLARIMWTGYRTK